MDWVVGRAEGVGKSEFPAAGLTSSQEVREGSLLVTAGGSLFFTGCKGLTWRSSGGAFGFVSVTWYWRLRQDDLIEQAIFSSESGSQTEVPSTAYFSAEMETTSGFAMTGVLTLTSLGLLCTNKCFKQDLPTAEGPMIMLRLIVTSTDPCLATASS